MDFAKVVGLLPMGREELAAKLGVSRAMLQDWLRAPVLDDRLRAGRRFIYRCLPPTGRTLSLLRSLLVAHAKQVAEALGTSLPPALEGPSVGVAAVPRKAPEFCEGDLPRLFAVLLPHRRRELAERLGVSVSRLEAWRRGDLSRYLQPDDKMLERVREVVEERGRELDAVRAWFAGAGRREEVPPWER